MATERAEQTERLAKLQAEETERKAKVWADQVYSRANGTLTVTSAKVDEAANQINDLTDLIVAQLAQLQNAVAGNRQALRDASACLNALFPENAEK